MEDSTNCIVEDVVLGEEDVPGGRLPHDQVDSNSVVQLQRWLYCRGVKSTGRKEELVERVKNCISSGYAQIDVSVDDGKWYRLKAGGQKVTAFRQLPVAPDSGWNTFPYRNVPQCFNYGHAFHYFVESLSNVATETTDSEDEQTQQCHSDIHTATPLKRGETHYKSGNVIDLQDAKISTHYFVKAKVHASYKSDIYTVQICMSQNSGFLINGTCNCKASAMGRCSQIVALVFALLQSPTENSESCTSKKCTWNMGKRTRKCPKSVLEFNYDSYKKKRQSVVDFDYNVSVRHGPFVTIRHKHDCYSWCYSN